MANPQSGGQNGVAPGFDQQIYPQAGPGVYRPQDASKPFTVNEALPYTPFTSVFPFEPGKAMTTTLLLLLVTLDFERPPLPVAQYYHVLWFTSTNDLISGA